MQASPTKKPFAPAIPQQSPSGVRGSMARTASTQWAQNIPSRAMNARAAVARGHLTGSLASTSASTSTSSSTAPAQRRPLSHAVTEPALRFSQPTVPSEAGTFVTQQDLLYNLKEGLRERHNELRPMWEYGTGDDGISPMARAASQAAGGLAGQDSGVFSVGAASTAAGSADADGDDGFDLDDVFGAPAGNLDLSYLGGNGDSQSSSSMARTITGGLKRALDGADEEEQGGAGGDDDEMATTDVEDEGEDAPGPFFAPSRRTAALRKGWGRTQSLPASAFQEMDF